MPEGNWLLMLSVSKNSDRQNGTQGDDLPDKTTVRRSLCKASAAM